MENLLFTFAPKKKQQKNKKKEKSPSEFLVEQQVKSNEQRAKSNDHLV